MKKEQNNNKKRPFITVKEAIIAVIVILMFAIAFEKPVSITGYAPPVPVRDVSEEEIVRFIKEIPEITVSDLAENIHSSDRQTMMVIYTSWCVYCKKLLRNISSLEKENKLEAVNLLILSTDEKKEALAKYILEHDYNKVFVPYILENGKKSELEDFLMSKGSFHSGSIPQTIFFSDRGSLISEARGNMGRKRILESLGISSEGE